MEYGGNGGLGCSCVVLLENQAIALSMFCGTLALDFKSDSRYLKIVIALTQMFFSSFRWSRLHIFQYIVHCNTESRGLQMSDYTETEMTCYPVNKIKNIRLLSFLNKSTRYRCLV